MTLISENYLPENLRDYELYSEITELLDFVYTKEEEILAPILHKYSKEGDLTKTYLLKIISEMGYDTIANMTELTNAEVQKIFDYLDLLHKHKGNKYGLEIFLQLLGLTYEIKEWWEWKLYTSNWMFPVSTARQYNYTKFPLILYKSGTVDDTWVLTFTDSTHFSCKSTYVDETNISISADYQPENGDSYYFKLMASGWEYVTGGGFGEGFGEEFEEGEEMTPVNWQAGDMVIFTTHNKTEADPHTFELELALADASVTYQIVNYLVDFCRSYVYPILNQIISILSDIANIGIVAHAIPSEIIYFGNIEVEDSVVIWDDDEDILIWDDGGDELIW